MWLELAFRLSVVDHSVFGLNVIKHSVFGLNGTGHDGAEHNGNRHTQTRRLAHLLHQRGCRIA
jgi:hypothetical protein